MVLKVGALWRLVASTCQHLASDSNWGPAWKMAGEDSFGDNAEPRIKRSPNFSQAYPGLLEAMLFWSRGKGQADFDD